MMGLKLRSVRSFRTGFIEWIDRHAVDEGRADTPYAGLSVFRISSTTVVRKEPAFGVTLGIVAQGSKALRVHGRTLEINPSNYLVVTREMQYDATVQPATGSGRSSASASRFPRTRRQGHGRACRRKRLTVQSTDCRPSQRRSRLRRRTALAAAECRRRSGRTADPGAAGGRRTCVSPAAIDAAAAMRGALRPGDARPITEAMRLMRMQAFQPLSVEAIARQVAMSPSHFAHRFRVVARMSPMRFVKEVRLDAARTLLLSEGVRASEVALRVGYESPAHFAAISNAALGLASTLRSRLR